MMLLDTSQARGTAGISQLQSKMCLLKGQLLKLQHFIAVPSQKYARGPWDQAAVSMLTNWVFGEMENRNRGDQGLYSNKETGFYFSLLRWQRGEVGERLWQDFLFHTIMKRQ